MTPRSCSPKRESIRSTSTWDAPCPRSRRPGWSEHDERVAQDPGTDPGHGRCRGRPITAKMRLGWDEETLTAPTWPQPWRMRESALSSCMDAPSAQGFDGVVNLEGIRKAAEAVKNIPVIGNGGATAGGRQAHDRKDRMRRGFRRAWRLLQPLIFLHTQRSNRELPSEPSFDERIRVLRRHYDLMVEVFGEDRGSLQFRKVAPWYSKRFGRSTFNSAVVRISSRDEFEQVLSDYLEWRKQFTDDSENFFRAYQLSPMVASFMEEEDEHQAKQRKPSPSPKAREVW